MNNTTEIKNRKTDQTCFYCGRPYRGDNTIPWNQGYGRYHQVPCHVKCEIEIEEEKEH